MMFSQPHATVKLEGMIKLLNGSELAGYIKERHVKQVRSLKGAKDFS